jgi:hypothetical protein
VQASAHGAGLFGLPCSSVLCNSVLCGGGEWIDVVLNIVMGVSREEFVLL